MDTFLKKDDIFNILSSTFFVMLSSMDDSGVFVTLIDPDWQKCGFQSHFQLPGDSVISKPVFVLL